MGESWIPLQQALKFYNFSSRTLLNSQSEGLLSPPGSTADSTCSVCLKAGDKGWLATMEWDTMATTGATDAHRWPRHWPMADRQPGVRALKSKGSPRLLKSRLFWWPPWDLILEILCMVMVGERQIHLISLALCHELYTNVNQFKRSF